VGIKATSPSHQALVHARNYRLSQYLGSFNTKYIISRGLKFSKILFSTKSNFFLLRKVKHLLKYFIFNMESSKLINYSKDIHWSCPNIIAIACITLMYKTGSYLQKTTRMQSSWAFFWSSSVWPTLWQTCEKWCDLQLYFHQILWGHLLLNIFYFTFGKKQTQHFIARK